jgi:hypothetical protein
MTSTRRRSSAHEEQEGAPPSINFCRSSDHVIGRLCECFIVAVVLRCCIVRIAMFHRLTLHVRIFQHLYPLRAANCVLQLREVV